MTKDNTKPNFLTRGGLWVVAQIALLALVALVPMRTGDIASPLAATQWLGAFMLSAAGALLLLAFVTLGRSLTPFPRPLEDAELKRNGPYAFMRHPIYTAVIVGSFGWALLWASGAGVAVAVVVALFMDRKATREERWLVEQFPGYVAYRARVRKLIPWVY